MERATSAFRVSTWSGEVFIAALHFGARAPRCAVRPRRPDRDLPGLEKKLRERARGRDLGEVAADLATVEERGAFRALFTPASAGVVKIPDALHTPKIDHFALPRAVPDVTAVPLLRWIALAELLGTPDGPV